MIDTIPMMNVVEIPLDESPRPVIGKQSALGLAELLLKDRIQVDDLLRDDSQQVDLIPRFLVISLASFSAYAWAMVFLLHTAPNGSIPSVLEDGWSFAVRPTVGLWLAYAVGLVAATGICLPSFYFYGLLAGIKISFLQVVTHCLKGQASTAIMLIGILPIYVAIALGMMIFAAPVVAQQVVLSIGLVLPFLAGLWGVYTLYQGFMRLADTLPGSRRDQRTCFLRRLTIAWAACYTAVTPLMIHALWTHFTG